MAYSWLSELDSNRRDAVNRLARGASELQSRQTVANRFENLVDAQLVDHLRLASFCVVP